MSEKKVKLRMGIHNRITKERWEAIKEDTNNGLPTAKIAKRHSVCDGTVRKVRRSKTYHEYRLRADDQIRSRKAPMVVIAPTSGLPFEDYGKKPIFFSPKKVKPSIDRPLSNRLDREAENTARALGVLLLGIIVLALVIVFVISISKGGK